MLDLTNPTGPPLTTGQLAHIVGLSPQTIRLEIQAHELAAIRVGRGRKRKQYRILWDVARAYAFRIGALPPEKNGIRHEHEVDRKQRVGLTSKPPGGIAG